MHMKHIEELVQKIDSAFAKEDWISVKKYNSELSDYEIREKLTTFHHKPEVIQIELTSKCNAQCVMCSHYYELNDCGREAGDNALMRFHELLPFCKLVLLNGYGEPFISTNFLDCIKLLRLYRVKAIVTTNLSLLTNSMCKIIPEVFEEINVSCNGYDKETYEKIHRGLNFDVFSENLSKLVQIYDSSKISLSCVVMVETVKWAPDIIRFAHEKGIKKVRFGRLGVSSFIRNYDQDASNYPNYSSFYLQKAKKLADELKIEMVFPENYQNSVNENLFDNEQTEVQQIHFRYDENYQNELRDEFKIYHAQGTYGCVEQKFDTTAITCRGICDWVAKGLYIDTHGELFTCCESSFSKYTDGWNGSKAQEFRNEFYNGHLPDFCKNCPFIINNELKLLECEKRQELYQSTDVVSSLGEDF